MMKKFPRFQDYNYDAGNPAKTIAVTPVTAVSPETAMQLHTEMVRLRIMEEELLEQYHPADEMRCPVHFCIGQEAVPAALSELLNKDDYLFSHHRSHGYYLAK